ERLERTREKQDKPVKAKRPKAAGPDTGGDHPRPLSKNRLQQLKERRTALEQEISALEQRKSALELELADPETYRSGGRPSELAAAVEEIKKSIAGAYREWERLLEYD
ncbi:MAG: hypothetical protein JXQ83_02935, partial [Candidatus Glassbacteria bacterium]|nr:hypothetical protein [Candidatus Glassbacteria bacterium]